MAPRTPIGGGYLLNMQEAGHSASAGAGPPRAVAKLRLLNCYYSGQPIGGGDGDLSTFPAPARGKGGVRCLPVGPAAAPRPAPAPNRRSLLAARAARRLCVKCRLREVPYNRGLGSPPRVNSARCATRGDGGLGARLGSARLGTGSHGIELSVNSPGSGRVLGEKRPRSSHNELEKHSMPKVQLIFILHSLFADGLLSCRKSPGVRCSEGAHRELPSTKGAHRCIGFRFPG
ncbi:max dimerization protein 4 isoform X4 [Aquila chrysaetos chrysaetos]|uniref:max dimerization protein 4 isoform X4 n=1 Tax=Aquila chrysaetos chrysaetos TaxID=223781 RepID=UPI001B7D47ED|nr:max dimerization protein 4 isoform X4 [Aquila chrysaetos chrysaetos]